jgi:hypothetical protein
MKNPKLGTKVVPFKKSIGRIGFPGAPVLIENQNKAIVNLERSNEWYRCQIEKQPFMIVTDFARKESDIHILLSKNGEKYCGDFFHESDCYAYKPLVKVKLYKNYKLRSLKSLEKAGLIKKVISETFGEEWVTYDDMPITYSIIENWKLPLKIVSIFSEEKLVLGHFITKETYEYIAIDWILKLATIQ